MLAMVNCFSKTIEWLCNMMFKKHTLIIVLIILLALILIAIVMMLYNEDLNGIEREIHKMPISK